MEPIVLPANQPPQRFYRGGLRLAGFRAGAAPGDRVPEDWIASTTCVRGHDPLGLTVLPGGQRLADAVAGDPAAWLGPAHVAQYGADTRVLVKLLDLGQRLAIHAHPDDAFAAQHVGTAHGKTEAWYILEPGTVWLGWRQDVAAQRLASAVAAQDIAWMLGAMHQVDVARHDTVYVPAGTPHAIGTGVELLEVQQPEDLSVLCEWEGFDIDGPAEGHLGLGFGVALGCIDRRGRTPGEVEALVGRGPRTGSVLPTPSREYFTLRRLCGERAEVPAGFRVAVVIEGVASIGWAGGALECPAGTAVVAPYAAGPITAAGGDVLVASAQ